MPASTDGAAHRDLPSMVARDLGARSGDLPATPGPHDALTDRDGSVSQ
jgi:hypothetical protein